MNRFVIVIFIFTMLFGCTTNLQRTYPKTNRSLLWTAMVAVAESPEYQAENVLKRWIVVENNVNANASLGIIEVRRILARSLQLPLQEVQNDRRNILFTVYLLPGELPTLKFVSLGSQMIPARGVNESERYFTAVEEMLEPPLGHVR